MATLRDKVIGAFLAAALAGAAGAVSVGASAWLDYRGAESDASEALRNWSRVINGYRVCQDREEWYRRSPDTECTLSGAQKLVDSSRWYALVSWREFVLSAKISAAIFVSAVLAIYLIISTVGDGGWRGRLRAFAGRVALRVRRRGSGGVFPNARKQP